MVPDLAELAEATRAFVQGDPGPSRAPAPGTAGWWGAATKAARGGFYPPDRPAELPAPARGASSLAPPPEAPARCGPQRMSRRAVKAQGGDDAR